MKNYHVILTGWGKTHGATQHEYRVKADSEGSAKEQAQARFNRKFRRVVLRMAATRSA